MKKLDRELGLFSVFTIACGAMLSGLFVLPGHAAQIGGSAVHLAFLLAGLLFVPAALSKAEMATALPEAGGDYIFIDRAFGPSISTVTGMGTWLALMLKSAFALVGMSAYLFLIVDLPPSYLKYFACGVGVFLVVMNCIGVKKTGQLQSFLVVATFVVLAAFIERGAVKVQPENFTRMFDSGLTGFLGATAFVFVSYAGVTKVASAAEEIKNPSQNIPWGMLLSLTVMTLFYVAVVYVVVGVVPVEELGGKTGIYKNAPVAQAAAQIMGDIGEIAISIISVLALTAMANAGLLASSRYPLALSRYDQLPEVFSSVHSTFKTPVLSVLVTGTAIILSIIFLPVIQLAKLASAFMLLVFALVHLSLIVFRESDIEWYRPEFTSPLYPYIQFLGVISSVLLIGFMGWLTILGSVGLIGVGIVWYLIYVRSRADRLGAIFQSATMDSEDLEMFEQARNTRRSRAESVIVPFFDLKDVDPMEIERRLRLAASLCAENERLDVLVFVEIAEQSLLSEYESDRTELELLRERTRLLKDEFENEIYVDQVITHNSRGALLNYVRQEHPHWVVFDWKKPSPWKILIGIEKWWLEDFPCDAMFFKDNDINSFENIIVAIEPGPYDGEVIYAAEQIANHFDGTVSFLTPVDGDDEEEQAFIESYQEELLDMMGEAATAETVNQNSWDDELIERSPETDLMLIGGRADDSFFKRDELVGLSTRLELQCNYARIRSNLKSPRSILQINQEHNLDIFDFLQNRGSFLRPEVEDKSDLFKQIASSFAVDEEQTPVIEEALWEREDMQNTFLEDGIAFPHGILQGLEETRVRFVVLDEPVTYTLDGDPVSFCVGTLGPPEDRENHLQILRRLSTVFVQTDAKERLKRAEDYDEVLGILSNYLSAVTHY